MSVTLNINGKQQTLAIEPRVTPGYLRERLGLTGSKKAATTDNAEPVRYWWIGEYTPCLALAGRRKQIVTVEGLAKGDVLHPYKLRL